MKNLRTSRQVDRGRGCPLRRGGGHMAGAPVLFPRRREEEAPGQQQGAVVEGLWQLEESRLFIRANCWLTLLGHRHLFQHFKEMPASQWGLSAGAEGFLILQVKKLESLGGDRASQGHTRAQRRSWIVSKDHDRRGKCESTAQGESS